MSSPASQEFRLVVVGPPVVGKSALTIRLTQSEFANEYDPTIEDSYKHHCDIDGINASLDILDTAGQEEYSSMRDLYMKTGEGFLLVFSLTDQNSFEEISTFYNQIMRVNGESADFIPMILVGNKSDLIGERQVSQDEAINLAQKIGCAYIETSAKTGTNVTEAFYGVVRTILNHNIFQANLKQTIYPNQQQQQQHQQKQQQQQNQQNQQQQNQNQKHASSSQQQKSSSKQNNSQSNKDSQIDSNDQNNDQKNNNQSNSTNQSNSNAKKASNQSSGESGGCCVIV